MYSGQISLNHLHASLQANVVKLETIDTPSYSTDINLHSVLHIHSYPASGIFSKLAFLKGEYDKLIVRDANGTIVWPGETLLVTQYALSMSLEGKFRTPDELSSMFANVTRRKL